MGVFPAFSLQFCVTPLTAKAWIPEQHATWGLVNVHLTTQGHFAKSVSIEQGTQATGACK